VCAVSVCLCASSLCSLAAFAWETQHALLQYATAMIDRILSMASSPAPRFAKIEIPPHPTHKVEHLRRWFGDRVIETKSRGITVAIEDRVMERAFSKVARDRLNPRALNSSASLRGGETFGFGESFSELDGRK
jgi:hypothetical protein